MARLFFAIWPPAGTAATLGRWAGPVQRDAGGRALERRRFAAHVTLLRKVPAGCRLLALPKLAWPVEEFSLVRSKLAAGGSRYEIVEKFSLR